MHRMSSGPAAASTTASPEQPGRIPTNHQTIDDCTPVHKRRKPRTYDAPLRTWTDVLAFFIFATLIGATAFIGLYMLIAVLFVLGQMVTS